MDAKELQDMKTLNQDKGYASEAIGELDRRTARSGPIPPPKGAKTIARITKIDEMLKGRGPTTLKELEMFLNIRPQEMGRIFSGMEISVIRCLSEKSRILDVKRFRRNAAS